MNIKNINGEKPHINHLDEKSKELVEVIIKICKESGLSYREINEALYTADRVQLYRVLNGKTD